MSIPLGGESALLPFIFYFLCGRDLEESLSSSRYQTCANSISEPELQNRPSVNVLRESVNLARLLDTAENLMRTSGASKKPEKHCQQYWDWARNQTPGQGLRLPGGFTSVSSKPITLSYSASSSSHSKQTADNKSVSILVRISTSTTLNGTPSGTRNHPGSPSAAATLQRLLAWLLRLATSSLLKITPGVSMQKPELERTPGNCPE
jgi:hypothetical protein